MTLTLDQLKAYYQSVLIMQYRNKTKAKATIAAVTAETWLDGLILTEAGCFDLETANGAQLDILGRIVGVRRQVPGLDLTHLFFEFTSHSGSPTGNGFNLYSTSPIPADLFDRYYLDSILTMTDDQMRTVIKLKIIFNTAARTAKAITEALFSVFGTAIAITDNLNTSVTFNISNPYHSAVAIADFLGVLPKGMGNSYTVNYI